MHRLGRNSTDAGCVGPRSPHSGYNGRPFTLHAGGLPSAALHDVVGEWAGIIVE